MFDIDEIAETISDSLAAELDEKMPDGFIQGGAADILSLVSVITAKTAEKLGGAENTDEDA